MNDKKFQIDSPWLFCVVWMLIFSGIKHFYLIPFHDNPSSEDVPGQKEIVKNKYLMKTD